MTETSESRDGTGAGDHDQPFIWDNWRAYLTPIQQGRATIMRGFVRDVARAPLCIRGRLRFGSDSEYIDLTPAGVYVASLYEPSAA